MVPGTNQPPGVLRMRGVRTVVRSEENEAKKEDVCFKDS